MNALKGFTWLLVYQAAGEIIVRLLGLPLPGPVLGMLLLLVSLMLYGRAPETLEAPAHALLKHLSLLFVPAGVGVLVHLNLLAAHWLPLLVATIASVIITLIATALTMNRLQAGADKDSPL